MSEADEALKLAERNGLLPGISVGRVNDVWGGYWQCATKHGVYNFRVPADLRDKDAPPMVKKKTRRDVVKGVAAVGASVATPAIALPQWIEDTQPIVPADHNRFAFTFYFDIKGNRAAALRIHNMMQGWVEGRAFDPEDVQVYIHSSKIEPVV